MFIAETISKREDLPATVGETHGHRAEKKTAFGFADDGLTVRPRSDDQELPKTVPVAVTPGQQQAAQRCALIEDIDLYKHLTIAPGSGLSEGSHCSCITGPALPEGRSLDGRMNKRISSIFGKYVSHVCAIL